MNNNRCVCCGKIIPEGRQVCLDCEHKINNNDSKNQKEISNEQSHK